MSFKTSYIYDLVDKISPKLKKVNSSLQKTSTQSKKTGEKASNSFKKFNKSLKPVKNNIDKLRKSFKSFNSEVGVKLSATFSAFTFLSLRGFNKQAQALEAVRVGLDSTNNAAKLTFETLRKEATRLQRETLFGDEEILTGATAQLLTFTNIAGKEFLRTQQAVLDVASRLSLARGGAVDLTSTAIQLGKALNDPVANLGALGRSGIQFSKDQKATIKRFAETNQLAKAQKLILDELDKQYGGTAKALAKVGTGPLKQLINAFGDLAEQIGKEQFKVIEPLIKSLRKMADGFNNLSPTIKKTIAIFSLIAITIAPLLASLGLFAIAIKALITPIAVLGVGIKFLALKSLKLLIISIKGVGIALRFLALNSIGLLIGGIASLSIAMFLMRDDVAKVFDWIGNKISSIINVISNKIDSFSNKIANFAESIGFDLGISKGQELDKILQQQKRELSFRVERSQSVDVGGTLGININAPSGTSANFTPVNNNPMRTNMSFTQSNPLLN